MDAVFLIISIITIISSIMVVFSKKLVHSAVYSGRRIHGHCRAVLTP